MKRLISLLLLVALIACLLGGCGSTTEIELMNTSLTIKFQSGNSRGTVTTEDGDVYEFRHSKGVCYITYPDGKTYSDRVSVYYSADNVVDGIGIVANKEYPDAYKGNEYLSTASLADAIALVKPKGVPVFGILVSFALIIAGVAIIVKSHALMEGVLYIRDKHKDPNHREVEHANILISGVIVAAVGLIVLIITAVSAV